MKGKRIGFTILLILLFTFGFNVFYTAKAFGNDGAGNIKCGEKSIILLDPGHGGMDSGAVSKDGIMEKEINLKIGNKLKDKLSKKGYEVFMTRDGDNGLYTKEGRTRKKKIEDLNNRCKLKESTKCNMFISIHLNMFPQPKYHGAQVWYSKNENSKRLANILQNNLINDLDKNNNRKEKAALNSYKVLRCRDNVPSVLVECGFLSNTEEKNKLTSNDYQDKIAESIAKSVDDYYLSN
ncbi:MAG: N-acetylmuramoyl-L-alanine amidase CwlD [Clostridiales bacterium]|jgi:N-acetylmuramoyl-L-alanine amidase|nr:N-acetylmuramoyl-L-alanine amidase CwlD [Clostridiales bacterium]